jgi:hypothetical protein
MSAGGDVSSALPEVPMTRWIIVAGLVVLNGILGVGVYQRLVERPTQAQIGGAKIDISAVAGNANGQSIIYLLDVSSGALVAQRVDSANNRTDIVAKRNVGADLSR